MTRTAWLWFSVLLSLSVGSNACALGKKRPEQPPREVCLLGDAGCVCYDPRFSEPPIGAQPIPCKPARAGTCYIRPYAEGPGTCRNYQAMGPVDYDADQEWKKENCWGPKDP